MYNLFLLPLSSYFLWLSKLRLLESFKKNGSKKTWTLCSSSFIAAEKQGFFFIQVHLASISMKQLTLINSGKMVALIEQSCSIRKFAEILKIHKSTVASVISEIVKN
jgi:hypothetical protein